MFEEWKRRRATESLEEIEADFKHRENEAVQGKMEKAYLEVYHVDTSEGILHLIDYIKSHNIHTTW